MEEPIPPLSICALASVWYERKLRTNTHQKQPSKAPSEDRQHVEMCRHLSHLCVSFDTTTIDRRNTPHQQLTSAWAPVRS